MDEPWIPIADTGLVNLHEIFQNPSLKALGGNPVQKIALLKLLLAICQAAYTPKNDEDWEAVGPDGLADKALEYLGKQRDCFWLYGDKPFLQMPAIVKAAKKSFGVVMPDIATGNTTVLTQSQKERPLSDAEKAILVVQLMGMALAGGQTDNSIVLSLGYLGKSSDKDKEKPSPGKPGPCIGSYGYLHNFLLGTTIAETLYLNLLTEENIKQQRIFTERLGPIPWETPPTGEDDEIAKKLQYSIMGRLVPFSRFVLLTEDGIHYSEGIIYPDYQDGGMPDPSVAMNGSGKKMQVLWTDSSKRPWRNLTSLLGFLQEGGTYFECPYIKLGLFRGRKILPAIGILSAGLQTSKKLKEQYVSGTDDYVESETFFESAVIDKYLYQNLKTEMSILDELDYVLRGSIYRYYEDPKQETKTKGKPNTKKQPKDKSLAKKLNKSSELFWQLCERRFQDLVNACGIRDGGKEAEKTRPYFLQCVRNVFETFCPRDTARQLEAWAKHYPNLSRYTAKKEEVTTD